MSDPPIAVIIDDEPANRDFLVRLIHQAHYDTRGAASGKEAITVIESLERTPAVIIVDSELPDIPGLDLITRFRSACPTSKIVMATMLDDHSIIKQAFENGCDAFLVKPNGFMELFNRLQRLESDPSCLSQIIIDRYGTRAYRP